MVLSPSEKLALDEFCERVRASFGPRVRRIVLFGSRAREEHVHGESDIDVCVVVDALTWQERREIAHVAGEMVDRHDAYIAPLAVSSEHMAFLTRRERLIAREIAKDGVAL